MYGTMQTQADAQHLFDEGCFKECLNVCDPVSAIAVHCLIRLSRLDDAMDAARELPDAAERWLFLGTIWSRMGREQEALRALQSGLEQAQPKSEQWFRGRFFLGLHYWSVGNTEDAKQEMKHALKHPATRVPALDLLAWIHLREGNAEKHIAMLKAALHCAIERKDKWFIGTIIHGLSVQARELYLPDIADLVLEHIEDGHPARLHDTLRNIAWCKSLSGDYMGCFRLFREATTTASTGAQKLRSLTDRVFIALGTVHGPMVLDELVRCIDMAESIDWETSGEERFSLLVLADIFVTRDVTRARGYLQKYRSIRTPLATSFAYNGDPRRDAIESWALARVLRYEGRTDEALAHFKSAHSVWLSLGCEWRRALCLHELGAIGEGDPQKAAAAVEIAHRFPGSWLAARILPEDTPYPLYAQLTRRQKDVLRCVYDGMKTAEIAKAWGTSAYAVKNRLQEVFEIFGVHSRAQLICECRKRGIL